MIKKRARWCGGLILLAAAGCGAMPETEESDETALAIAPDLDGVAPVDSVDVPPLEPPTAPDPATGQTTVSGVLPGTASVDPRLNEKLLAAHQYASSLGAELTTLNGEPTAILPEDGKSLAAAKASKSVKIRGEKQQRNAWCVPASSRVALSALLSSPPTQTTLAGEEHTSSDGTYMKYVPPALNAHENRNYYLRDTSVGNVTRLIELVRDDIDYVHAALIPAVQGHDLPAWAARGYWGYHAIVIYGWNVVSKKPYRLNLYDPLNVSWSGPYNVYASTVLKAMKDNSNELIW